jgi:hypothetical protein
MMTRECTPEQLQLLKTYAHTEMVSDFFHRLWQRFITSREFDERDLHTLRSIQQAAELSDRGVLEAQLAGIEYGIKATRRYTPQQLNLLLTYDYRTVRDFYERIYTHFVASREPDEGDLQTLRSLQQATGLTEQEIQFTERIKPYYYVKAIRNEHTLPVIDPQIAGAGRPILKRGELVHYGYGAVKYDTKGVISKNLGGVPGVNFRVIKGVNYHVGDWKNTIKHDPTTEVLAAHPSSGVLFITNKRIFLHPAAGQAPISLALHKVLSFTCYDNGIHVWQEGRQNFYLFNVANSGAVEIFALCLIFLLDTESRLQYAQKERSPFRDIPTEVKNRVLARDGGQCRMCGRSEGIHFDHIIPVSKGGDNTEANIQILCIDCNLRKHDKII